MRLRTAFLLSPLLALACGSKDPEPAPAAAPAAAAAGLDGMTEYMRKSKSAEARVHLKSIATSVQLAREELQVGPDGQARPATLASAPLTPPAGACCDQPHKKCVPNRADWQHAGWQAIHFEMSDPHYYSYELVVEADGFVARAVGDLDCDGELSTFELRGTAKPDGTWEIAAAPTSDAPLE